MVDTVARWVSGGESAIATHVVDISGIAIGETAIVALVIGSTSVTVTPPAGWVEIFTKTTMGSRACVAYRFTKSDELEVSATFTMSTGTGTKHALIGVLGAAPANWIVGPLWTRTLHGTTLTNVIDGVTTLAADNLALVLSFEATTAAESPNSISSVNNGFTELGYAAQNTIIETIWAGTKDIPTAGDVGDTTVTYRNTQASNGAGIMIAFPQGPFIPMGALVTLGNGTLARLSYINALGVRTAPTSVRMLKPGFQDVAQMLTIPGATWAHRGGSEFYPDMSEYGYDQSILRGFGAIEFSAQRSLDGWWFGCHNPDINEISEETGLPDIKDMTREEIQAYANKDNPTILHPSRPFFSLEDFLLKYGDTHVLIMDPKNALAYNSEFLAICDGIVAKERLIWKYTLGGVGSVGPSNGAQAALNRGWGGTWGYGYDTDVDSGAFAEQAVKPAWTTIGMNIGAAQSYWDTAIAIGKPLVGHIANSQADYNTAITKGADMVQCADVTTIQSVSI